MSRTAIAEGQDEIECSSPQLPAILPEPSLAERSAIIEAQARVNGRRRRTQVGSAPMQKGRVPLLPGHSDVEGFHDRLRDAFGTTSAGFVNSQVRIITRTLGSDQGQPDVDAVNAVIAMVDGAKPENEIEAAAAVQVGLSHFISCDMLRRIMATGSLEQKERYGNLASKLQRTMAAHVEILMKLRGGRDSGVGIGQVTVNEGGQAIVGSVTVEAPRGKNGR